jgi:hypothetical protein
MVLKDVEETIKMGKNGINRAILLIIEVYNCILFLKKKKGVKIVNIL